MGEMGKGGQKIKRKKILYIICIIYNMSLSLDIVIWDLGLPIDLGKRYLCCLLCLTSFERIFIYL